MLSDEQMLINMCNMMDKFCIPHNCNGDNIIEINKHYRIEINKTTNPWHCVLKYDGQEIYFSNPTGIIIMLKARLAQEKFYKNKIQKMNKSVTVKPL